MCKWTVDEKDGHKSLEIHLYKYDNDIGWYT